MSCVAYSTPFDRIKCVSMKSSSNNREWMRKHTSVFPSFYRNYKLQYKGFEKILDHNSNVKIKSFYFHEFDKVRLRSYKFSNIQNKCQQIFFPRALLTWIWYLPKSIAAYCEEKPFRIEYLLFIFGSTPHILHLQGIDILPKRIPTSNVQVRQISEFQNWSAEATQLDSVRHQYGS